ncbi:MAG: radical SAM protein [Theionarchaea archaeon]|nr:radical SAM protein [Theionarchaea archaeon]
MKVSKYTILLKLEEDEYLLINSRSGAVDLVDADVINLLHTLSDADPAVIECLKERGHLTELSPEQEVDEMEAMCSQYVLTHQERYTHVIIPTYRCNLECPYCFLLDLQTKGKSWVNTVIDSAHVDKIFEAATALDTSSRGSLVLYGGEPLLLKNKPIIEEILQKGRQLGYTFGMSTNGLTVPAFLDVLTEYSAALQITIDGPEKVHNARRIKKNGEGTFNEVVQGVDAAVEAGLSVTLRTNLDKDNITDFPQIVTFYINKGWYDNPNVSMQFSTVFKKPCSTYESLIYPGEVHEAVVSMTEKTPEIWKFGFDFRGVELFESIFSKGVTGPPRFWYCEATSGMLIYDPFGDIYVCWEHVGEESTRVGAYYPRLTWNDQYNQWKERTVFTIPECRECVYALFCGGGCGYEALERYGTLSKPVCYDYHNVFTTAIPALYKLMRGDNAQKE